MEQIDAIMTVLALALVFVVVPWALRCNHVTHRQQLQLIDAAFSRVGLASGWRIKEDHYDQHFFRLMTFRNPWRLYPPLWAHAAQAHVKPYWETEISAAPTAIEVTQ